MDQITQTITSALVSLLGALLSVLAGYAIVYARTRLKFMSEAFLQELARSGIAFAEEKAATYLKANGERLASKLKLDAAVEYVISKAPNVSAQEAEVLVHTELPKVMLGAAGFVRALSAAVQTPEGPKA